MPALIQHLQADYTGLERLYSAPYSTERRRHLQERFAYWQNVLDRMPFEELSAQDKADWLLLRNYLQSEQRQLLREAERFEEMQPLIPFARALIALEEARRRLEEVDAAAVARLLHDACAQMQSLQTALEAAAQNAADTLPRPVIAHRAAQTLDKLRTTLSDWFAFSFGYDPLFTWWVEQPYRALDTALEQYAAFLRRRLAHAEDSDAIIGDSIGRDALQEELDRACIPYSPEELIAIALQEKEWCLAELQRAAQEMGFGEDWKAALEKVKTAHVAPGEQPALVRDLAREAIAYVEANDLLTVPPLARQGWRMEMLSPEKQKINPFFLGGETIQVSFPTNAMPHEQKRMSLRGNNRHFSRATVQHELIPGHYMQQYAQERYRPYRQLFSTPFWVEGWTLHWEMLLWDLGFAQSPEDRIGMLFWRLHRCARVEFSLAFHLGRMTPQECVTMLVEEVGHERDNATAEVRRSFGGDYEPLYQCAYLIGGLQVRALHRELVGSGRLTHRAFHDAFLRENCMPIAFVRALLSDIPLERDFRGDWRFADPPA
jgi:uncharacterized protein (DUF885 family)